METNFQRFINLLQWRRQRGAGEPLAPQKVNLGTLAMYIATGLRTPARILYIPIRMTCPLLSSSSSAKKTLPRKGKQLELV